MKKLIPFIVAPLILAALPARADFQSHSVRKDSLHAGRVSRLIASSVSARIGGFVAAGVGGIAMWLVTNIVWPAVKRAFNLG